MPDSDELVIRYLPPGSLQQYENNARLHSDEQIEELRASIRKFGFTNPILLDEAGVIRAGHGRQRAAILEELPEVPTITIPGLSDAEWRAYVIADNRIPLNAEWDFDLLKLEVSELAAMDFDVTLTGLNEMELKAIFGQTIDDPMGEWKGMPAFGQENQKPFRSILIHFGSQEMVDEFLEKTGMTITKQTRYTWYPFVDRDCTTRDQFEDDAA